MHTTCQKIIKYLNAFILFYSAFFIHLNLTWLSLLLCATVYRMEFQYGFSVPVSQLEGVCGRLCPALCVCCGGTYLHARKSQILPRGNQIFLNCYSSTNVHTDIHWCSDISRICCISCIFKICLRAYQFCIQYLYNNASGKWRVFPSRCLIRPNSVSHPKLLEKAIYAK